MMAHLINGIWTRFECVFCMVQHFCLFELYDSLSDAQQATDPPSSSLKSHSYFKSSRVFVFILPFGLFSLCTSYRYNVHNKFPSTLHSVCIVWRWFSIPVETIYKFYLVLLISLTHSIQYINYYLWQEVMKW